MDPLVDILKRLSDAKVEFALIGGMAAVAHGSPVVTQDLDVCVPFDDINLSRILDALRPIHPRLRFRPDRMPLPEDPSRLRGIKNLNLDTDLGVLDLLGEITGVGSFADLKGKTQIMNLGGVQCQVLNLDTLIVAKRAVGRDKDKIGVMHLEAIRKKLRDNSRLFDPPNS